jgi:ABC-2 type transport system permease protein
MSTVIAWLIAGLYLPGLYRIQLPWDMLLVIAIFFVPTYAIVAGMMIAIGSVVAESQEGQQISGIINLLFTFPVFFAALAFANPDSPLMVALSLWPTTAMITIVMRWGLTVVPWWQIALGWVINVGTAAIVVWAASRIFRAGMLRYGQRISLKAAFGALLPK